MSHPLPIEIRGMGVYVPEEVVRNSHFAAYLDTSDDWIVPRTGIRERRKAAPNECTSTMAAEASRKALADAGMTIDDIDLIVCATATGDCPFPATATFIQAALGGHKREIPAFDVGGACAGFLYGLATAGAMITAGLFRRALVIGAETLTRYADPEDRRTIVLFGDAAGATVIQRCNDPDRGVLYCELGCDGTHTDLIIVPAGGSRRFTSESTMAERLQFMRMKGREVYKFAVTKMVELIERALDKLKLTPEDIKLVVPHQSNLRIIESVQEKIGFPREKVAVNIERFGNTSAASIPMALEEHRRNGTVKEGDLVLLIAMGAGFAWGTIVIRL
ncbi:MAG: beta-ketoacyl-ACP synthase III [Planctomycetota bacterium]